jgi:hypothetical protein
MAGNVPDANAPFAEASPPSVPPEATNWLGSMAGTGRITGDIVSPATEESEWELLRG